jgi:hypothetical protein
MPDADVHPISGCRELTSSERATVERARVLAGLTGSELRAHTRETDLTLAVFSALGECQHLLRELADIAER